LISSPVFTTPDNTITVLPLSIIVAVGCSLLPLGGLNLVLFYFNIDPHPQFLNKIVPFYKAFPTRENFIFMKMGRYVCFEVNFIWIPLLAPRKQPFKLRDR
jgi:hypothetical protein